MKIASAIHVRSYAVVCVSDSLGILSRGGPCCFTFIMRHLLEGDVLACREVQGLGLLQRLGVPLHDVVHFDGHGALRRVVEHRRVHVGRRDHGSCKEEVCASSKQCQATKHTQKSRMAAANHHGRYCKSHLCGRWVGQMQGKGRPSERLANRAGNSRMMPGRIENYCYETTEANINA